MIGDRGEEVRVLVMTIPKEDGAAAVGRSGQGCSKGADRTGRVESQLDGSCRWAGGDV
jgi:hypothetical protein